MLRAQSQGELKMTISVKSFPIGESDFEAIIDEGKIYIDKTSYLKSLLTSAVEVFHFLRPHGFGKTLSMSMLSTFLEMNYENPEDRSRQENLFKDLKVYKENRKLCDEYMGRYPVISLSLKDTEGANFEEAAYRVIAIFAGLARKFNFLRKNKDLDTLCIRSKVSTLGLLKFPRHCLLKNSISSFIRQRFIFQFVSVNTHISEQKFKVIFQINSMDFAGFVK